MASVFKRKGAKRYTIKYVDHTGKRREKSGYSDKQKTQRLAAKLDDESKLCRDGLMDPIAQNTSDQSKRSIEKHLSEFQAKMAAGGKSEKHISHTCNVIQRIVETIGVTTPSDINADRVNAYAKAMRDDNAAARTIQAHLTAIKAFTAWLFAGGKLARDPLASIRKPSPKADRRRERRMLLPAEWDGLGDILSEPGAVVREAISPGERLLLYATAIQTGLRAKELRGLTKGRLFLDVDPPFIVAKAAGTKNRKDARQYITSELKRELRGHVSTKAPKAPVFAMPSEWRTAAMIRADVHEARRAWLEAVRDDPEEYQRREESDFLLDVNHENERLDFHSLRHTCGAWLAMTGAHPKAVQSVMRHSTITLTMDTYGHLFPGQEADTVARFPSMLAGSDKILQAATGTDCQTPSDIHHIAHHLMTAEGHHTPSHVTCQRCDETSKKGRAPRGNRRDDKGKGNDRHGLTSDAINGLGGTRTLTTLSGQRILSPQRLPIPPRARGGASDDMRCPTFSILPCSSGLTSLVVNSSSVLSATCVGTRWSAEVAGRCRNRCKDLGWRSFVPVSSGRDGR